MEQAIREIARALEEKRFATKQEIHQVKLSVARKYHLPRIPKDSEVLRYCGKKFLRKKQVRTLSGVAVVAVMTSPYSCPGECIYCPGGVSMGTPKSYTGKEPASMRAAQLGFDPYLQTKTRLAQLRSIGHSTSKVELIVMGGTFTSRSKKYQNWFVKRCFDALNARTASTLEEAQLTNERSDSRCVGLTIETRPDFCMAREIDQMLKLGCTRVELGVQTLFAPILELVNRGHTVKDTIKATQLAKDAGLKVCYHLMPGLPGSSIAKDIEVFRRVFEDEKFRPDLLKVYPTLVLKGTGLYELWRNGEYKPLSTGNALALLEEAVKYIPPWVRVQRVQRDIPAKLIERGVRKSNLREMIKGKCRCIRCREVGHRLLKDGIKPSEIELVKREYRASGGKEIFLAFEDVGRDILVAYLRLRLPSSAYSKELEGCAVIRELRVCGEVVGIGEKREYGWQHKGYGGKLLGKAEKIARDEYGKKLMVLSGVGAREYYRKRGYYRKKFWMGK